PRVRLDSATDAPNEVDNLLRNEVVDDVRREHDVMPPGRSFPMASPAVIDTRSATGEAASLRSAISATSGISKSVPSRFGFADRIATRNEPVPPPTSRSRL